MDVPKHLLRRHRQFIDKVRMSILGRERTVWNTLELCLDLFKNNVEGCLVECGVYAGGHPAVMAYAADQAGENRAVHLFDSFCGIPVGGPRDHEDITAAVGKGDGSLVSSGESACSLEQVQRRLKSWGFDPNRFHYHKGWFQDTLPGIDIGKIALLRLDGDLYESTKVCLENLYPSVSVGGYVIIDDWNLQGCREAVFEYLGKIGEKPVMQLTNDDISRVCFWKRDILTN